MPIAIVIAGALAALAIWFRPGASTAAPAPLSGPRAAVELNAGAVGPTAASPPPATATSAPAQSTQPNAAGVTDYRTIGDLLSRVTPVGQPAYRAPSVDPYALAVVQNSGAILTSVTGLAKELPGIVTGLGNLFGGGSPSVRDVDGFGYSVDGSFGYSGAIGDVYEGEDLGQFYTASENRGGGSPVPL